MLKYYSYYNVGGYKDMFLGDSTQSTEYSYYIPLLPIWKKRAESGDSSLTEKIESLEKLPKINILTKETSYGLPSAAKTLISHGGYRIYLVAENEAATTTGTSMTKDSLMRMVHARSLDSGNLSTVLRRFSRYLELRQNSGIHQKCNQHNAY